MRNENEIGLLKTAVGIQESTIKAQRRKISELEARIAEMESVAKVGIGLQYAVDEMPEGWVMDVAITRGDCVVMIGRNGEEMPLMTKVVPVDEAGQALIEGAVYAGRLNKGESCVCQKCSGGERC